MGEALGKSLLAGLLMIGFLALTGGVALVSGLVALFVHGAAKTVAGGHTELDDISDDW